MGIEADIITQLNATAGLTAIVSTKIYAGGFASFLATMPFVTVEQQSGPLDYLVDGGTNLRREATFAVTGWAESYATAISIEPQLIAALLATGGTWGSSTVQTCFVRNRDDLTVPDVDAGKIYRGRRVLFEIAYEVTA